MLKISEQDIAKLTDCLGIPFAPLISGEGRVCFATNKDVRPEFLESFNERHILAYISSYLNKNPQLIESAIIKIPFPKDADSFWKNVLNDNDLIYLEESDFVVIFYNK